MDSPSAQPGTSSPPEDLDLYCLECGYNLRGLSGDPRRCPECFHLNPVGEAELSAEVISRQLRRMETYPAMCFGLALVSAAWLIGAIILAFGAGALDAVPCCVILGLVSAVMGFVALGEFQRSCLGKPGWPKALLRYHLYGGVMALAVVLGVAATARGLFFYARSVTEFFFGVLILIVSIVVGIPRISRWAHRRAREGLEPLQREVAVKLARDRVRKRLRQPH